MLKRLDRYILFRFIKVFFFILIILGVLITAIDVTDKLEDYIKHQLAFSQILRYYRGLTLYVLTLSMPLVVFVATVFVASRMASHSEIVAILSAGVTFRRLLSPFAVGAIFLAILNFFLIGWMVPNESKFWVEFDKKYIKKPFRYNERHIYINISESAVLYLWRYENTTQTAYNISLDSILGTEIKTRLRATSMQWDSLAHNWRLENWSIRRFGLDQDNLTKGNYKDTTLALSPKDFLDNYGLKETFNLDELKQYIVYLEQRGANAKPFIVEKQARYMQPFALILLTILGVIVSATRVREGTAWRLFISFLLVFVYIIFYVLVKSMAEVGSMPTWLALWLPNTIFSGIILSLYFKMRH